SASNSPLSLSASPLGLSSSPITMDQTQPPAKRQRRVSTRQVASTPGISRRSSNQNLPLWSSSHQERFARRLARITASCGFPFSWVNNPEWIGFCNKFVPGAEPVSRKMLANKWIPDEVERYRNMGRERSKNTLATIQCDGWSGINFHHFIAFIITTSLREVHTVYVHDASTERKTAENLGEVIVKVKQKVESEWKASVIAITSDASGESSKARKLMVGKFPELVTPDCYAHQV
ncbi:hypothetical protein BD779DRAFT_1414713, partial [Infundibulicybe gibba]